MAHLRPVTIRFFWVMLAVTVAVTALGAVILGLTGRPPPAILSFVPPAVAGFDAGREIKRREGPGLSARSWMGYAAICFCVNIATSIVIAVGALSSAGLLGGFFASGFGPILAPFAIFAALFFIMIRVTMWFGARSVA